MPKNKIAPEVRYATRVFIKAQEKEDQMSALAAMQIFARFPEDVQQAARQLVATENPNGITIRRRGRRADLREQNPDALLIKVSIAGSGYGTWRTEKDKDLYVPPPDEASAYDWSQTDSAVTSYFRDTGKGPELLFAGPGGKGTTGALAGPFDQGSNSIDKLVRDVPRQVIEQISANDPDHDKEIVVLIRSHSRGAVAADQVANLLKSKAEYKGRISVELVMVDPVPGPSQSGEKLKIDVGGIDQSTLVLSVNPGKGFFLNESFTPQRVLGAKRIIISTQDHAVGLDEGFVYQDRRYKGSAMNSLPEGVYVDMNDPGRSSTPLSMVASLAEMNAAIDQAEVELEDDDGVGLIELDEDAVTEQQVRKDTYEQARVAVKRASKASSGSNNSKRLKVIDKVLRDYVGV